MAEIEVFETKGKPLDFRIVKDLFMLAQSLQEGTCQSIDITRNEPFRHHVSVGTKFKLSESSTFRGIIFSAWIDYPDTEGETTEVVFVCQYDPNWRNEFFSGLLVDGLAEELMSKFGPCQVN